MNNNSKKPGYGLGVAGFVVGTLGLLICWIPWVGIWPAFLGLILSAIAISIASRAEYKKGLIIAGLAISLVASIISGWITYKATTFIGNKFDNVKEEFRKEMEKEETKGSLFEMEDALEEMEDELKEAEEEINKAAEVDYDKLIEEGDYDAILDDYEEMVDEYAELVKKSEDGDMSAVGSYMKLATKLSVISMKMLAVMPKLSEEQKDRLDEINSKYDDVQ